MNLSRHLVWQLVGIWLTATSVCIAQGQSKMYWSDRIADTIRRANLDGTDIETLVSGLGEPRGVAVDFVNHRLYWADNGEDKIQRSMLDGSQIEDLVTTDLRFPAGIALDVASDKMYWADANAGRIQRANLDGTNVEEIVGGLGNPYYVTLDLQKDHLYWTDYGTDKIQRANLDGTDMTDLVTTGLSLPRGIDLDLENNKMYWADRQLDIVQRSNLDGTGVETLHSAMPSSAAPHGVALDLTADHVYWVDNGLVTIKRANLDGTNVVTILDGTSEYLEKPWQIVLDVRHPLVGENPIDTLSQAIVDGSQEMGYDYNQDGSVNSMDRNFVIDFVLNSQFGDVDLNGSFDTEDLVEVFQTGEYEDAIPGNSRWAEGDWNGDLDFTSDDLVESFIAGNYEFETGARTIVVPEPATLALTTIGLMILGAGWRRRWATDIRER